MTTRPRPRGRRATLPFVALLLAAFGAPALRAQVQFTAVSAGDATSFSIIAWTRAIDPVAPAVTPLVLSVATDPNFSFVVAAVPCATDANRDYTCKQQVGQLQSGMRYYYRFAAGAIRSPVGVFVTAPSPAARAPFRLGFTGDADGGWRPYPASVNLAARSFDCVVFLGDTMYETASGSPGNNSSPAAALTDTAAATPARLLVDYRLKYLENVLPVSTGSFAGLNDFFAAAGQYTLLDNHELGNRQYINGGAPAGGAIAGQPTGAGVDATLPANDVNLSTNPADYMNRAAGFDALMQAYLDYHAIRETRVSAPGDVRSDGTRQLYFSQPWGAQAIFVNVDDRSYRDIRMRAVVGTGTVDDTAFYGNGTRADHPQRTMLGATQRAWLETTLLNAHNAGVTWKIVAISSPIDQLGPIPIGMASATAADGGKSWVGGYRAERNALLRFIADNGITNVVFISTDDHQNRVNELFYNPNPANPDEQVRVPKCFTIVAGPIGAGGPDTITNHTFGNLKSLADALAAAQRAARIDPIGLDPAYPGLHDVTREGDPAADTLRQPIDFYSPDTFNYTALQIGSDRPVLTVTTYGIDSYARNVFPQVATTGLVRSVLSFRIDPDAPLHPASFTAFGAGCPGNAGVPTLAAARGSLPWLGEFFTLRATTLGPSAASNVPLLMLGDSRTRWNSLSLPLDLAAYGMPSCFLYVNPIAAVRLANVGGSASWTVEVPNNATLVGKALYAQCAVTSPGANPAGVAFSNAGELLFGAH